MDYFNFEDASQAIPNFDLDDFDSVQGEVNEAEAQSSYEALFFDKSSSLPIEPPVLSAPRTLTLVNNTDIEVIPHADDSHGVYPMFRAKEPCDLCRRMGLDCFLASRGTMTTGCTCCISLYRECSFTHQKGPRGFVTTFPGMPEDSMVSEGPIHAQTRPLKSFEDSRQRKNGARFPRDSVKILKQWLSEHIDHPYPNDREKDELKQLTGLKRSQISNWLANARRRGKVRPASGPGSPIIGAMDIRQRCDDVEVADLNPLDRWKASPPENEPASMTAIARAVTAAPLPVNSSSQSSLRGSRTSSRRTSSEDESSFSMFQAPSVSSFDTGRSSTSDLSFASSRSHRSKGSFASSVERRRRRRAPMTQRAVAQNAKSRSARIFQCTFCTDTFPAKYDWQRHEKSLHLALERWTCCPNGGIVEVPITGCRHCVFCQEINPSPEHLETHNFMACQEKTQQERTFYRKDHLRQHLKLLHNAKFDPSMEAWKSTTNEIKSRCGFCPSVFSTWQQRADHLAAHFRNGADMSTWGGGWGFEPYVERLVENAMPPYLIGTERASMDPFVAKQITPGSTLEPSLTHSTSVTSNDEYRIARDSNCWRRLEQELTKHVQRQRAQGSTPSDRELQDISRKIIYDDDDPWNQTAADNKTWLETFKCQVGITVCPPEMQPPRLDEVAIMAPYVVKGGLRNRAVGRTQENVASEAFAPNVPVLPHSPAPGYDPIMDIDFDQLDFNDLELGTLDSVAVDGDLSLQRLGANGQFGQTHSENLLGTFESPFGLQQKQIQEDSLMSEYDVDQLTAYMAGFK